MKIEAIKRKQKRNEKKLKLIEHLGGVCSKCGEKDPLFLDFHHKCADEKDFSIGSNLGKSYKILLAEVKKCCLLCVKCHREIEALLDHIKMVGISVGHIQHKSIKNNPLNFR